VISIITDQELVLKKEDRGPFLDSSLYSLLPTTHLSVHVVHVVGVQESHGIVLVVLIEGEGEVVGHV
jgi:hypothetical protein